MESKKWYPSHKFFCILFPVTQLFFLSFSRSSDSITVSNKNKTSKKEPTSEFEITIKYFRKNSKIPLLCQCRLFINTEVSKYSIMFRDITFFLRWYNVIHWSSHIYKKSYSLSFYSFLAKFTEWHRGSGIVKLKKCDKVKWGEKFHYASDMIF